MHLNFSNKDEATTLDQLGGILPKFKGKYTNATVTCVQGRELEKSKEFQKLIEICNYSLQNTGADSSAQNGLTEKTSRDLAETMNIAL